MKVLVSVATKYGATGEIAQAVAVLRPEKVGAIEQFDAVVLGSAVYMASGSNPPASWQNARPPHWPPGRSGCFPAAVGEPAKPAENPVDVTKILQAIKARDHQIFTGELVKKHPSFPDRAMASAIRAAEGDFRNWADIRAWATSIADALPA